eukprot:12138984-Alexandrium_andersonii.AAC.1
MVWAFKNCESGQSAPRKRGAPPFSMIERICARTSQEIDRLNTKERFNRQNSIGPASSNPADAPVDVAADPNDVSEQTLI